MEEMTATQTEVIDLLITEKATKELSAIMKEQQIAEPFYLRIGIQGGGCSGFAYALAFDDQISETDHTFTFGGIKVAVDYKSMLYLKGATMDYYEGAEGKGFTFDNPNATRTCGCGSSC
jgi:iron-sulfur cluster assembly protein